MKWIVIAAVLAATSAQAQQVQCTQRQQLLDLLANKYGESRVAVGMAGTSAMMEVFVNPDTGTWTTAVSMPDGRMCMTGSGTDYQAIAPEPAGVPG